MLGHEAGLFVPTGSLGNQLGVRLLVPPGCGAPVRPAGPRGARRAGGPRRARRGDHAHVVGPGWPARPAGRDRDGSPGRRSLPGVHGRRRRGGHPQLRRWDGPGPRGPAHPGGVGGRGGDRAAPGRRAAVERPRGLRRGAGRHRRPVRHRVGVPVEGPRGPGGLGPGLLGRADRRGRACGASATAPGCARWGSWRPRACTPSTITSSGSPRTMPGPAAWPGPSRRCVRTWWIRQPSRPNIVVLDLTAGTGREGLAGAAREQGVAVSVLGARTARLVTHMDVDDDGIDRAADVLRGLLVRLRPRPTGGRAPRRTSPPRCTARRRGCGWSARRRRR